MDPVVYKVGRKIENGALLDGENSALAKTNHFPMRRIIIIIIILQLEGMQYTFCGVHFFLLLFLWTVCVFDTAPIKQISILRFEVSLLHIYDKFVTKNRHSCVHTFYKKK